tara:strand:+ start:15563 stop:15835 length:273 start_codon:yes stop_codon:yes gene_type:complete
MSKSNVAFLTVSEFKQATGNSTANIEVLRNKSTNCLFMALSGVNYRVEQAIDNSLPIKVLVPIEAGVNDYANACLVNVDPSKGADTVFSL